jgi:beta-lactamase regulating signal transducer with metallopeptidase domain
MQALSHSPFLQALGYAIANSLWQVALLWLVVVLLGLINFSAATRYRIALTAQLGAFAWFLITFKVYFQQCTAAVQALDSLNITNENAWVVTPEGTSFRSVLLAWTIKIEQLLPFLSIAYLFLLVFLAVKWMRTYRKAQSIRMTGLQKIDVEWRLFVQKVATQLNIKPKVQIFLSSVVNSPLTIGYLKPVILIPVASITHLTPQQLEALILHELAHIKRADYFINLLQSIIEITLFFNPFTQLLSRQIRNERENSCDDWVLQFQYNPTMYAEALLRIAHLQVAPAFAMQARGNKGELLPRVKRMLNQQEKNFDYKRHLVALLIMTGVLSMTAWLQAGSRTVLAQSQQNASQRSVVIEPITARVDNPLFNPVFFLAKPLQEEVRKAKVKEKGEEKIRTVTAVRYQEPAVTEAQPEAANEDTVREIPAPLYTLTTASGSSIQLPQIVFQMHTQQLQEIAQPSSITIAPPVSNTHQFLFFRREQEAGARRESHIRMSGSIATVSGENIRATARSGREFGPPPPAAPAEQMMRRMTADSSRRKRYHGNVNRMIASILKEAADSARLRKSLPIRLFKQVPVKDMIDLEVMDEAFKMFDRKDTWAYFRPVVQERDRADVAAVNAASRPMMANAGSTAPLTITTGEAITVDVNNKPIVLTVGRHQAATATACPERPQQFQFQPQPQPQQQVVTTYQYRDVMITISSNTTNGNTMPVSQFITVRKVPKNTKENEMTPGFLVDEPATGNEELLHD